MNAEDGNTMVVSLIEIMHDAIVVIPFDFALSEPEPPPSDVLLYPCPTYDRHNNAQWTRGHENSIENDLQ